MDYAIKKGDIVLAEIYFTLLDLDNNCGIGNCVEIGFTPMTAEAESTHYKNIVLTLLLDKIIEEAKDEGYKRVIMHDNDGSFCYKFMRYFKLLAGGPAPGNHGDYKNHLGSLVLADAPKLKRRKIPSDITIEEL